MSGIMVGRQLACRSGVGRHHMTRKGGGVGPASSTPRAHAAPDTHCYSNYSKLREAKLVLPRLGPAWLRSGRRDSESRGPARRL
jgi:hypothetical protein